MRNRKRRDIPLALALALGVGLLLYFLARPAGTPRTLNNPLHASWWDSFDNPERIKETDGAPFNPDGIRLSHIHDLGAPIPDASRLRRFTLAPDGQLFGVASVNGDASEHLFSYNPHSRQTTDLGILAQQDYVDNLIVNPIRQEAYAGIRCQENTCASHILVYNFQSGGSSHISLSFADENTMVYYYGITAEGVLYGVADDHLFSYNPETDEVRDLIAPSDQWHDVGKAIVNADGNLYGITVRGVFKYQPGADDLSWVMDWPEDTFLGDMLQGPKNTLYLFTESTAYIYNPKDGTITETALATGALARSNWVSVLDGDLIGSGEWKLRRYNLAEKSFSLLENLETNRCDGMAGAVGQSIYLYQNSRMLYVRQDVEPKWRQAYRDRYAKIVPGLPAWAQPWVPYPQPVQEYRKELRPVHLLVYEPDTFIEEGTLTSVPIQPHALLVTHTVAAAGVPLLAWGNDEALYGIKGGPVAIVRYDPQSLEATASITLPLSNNFDFYRQRPVIAGLSGKVIAGGSANFLSPIKHAELVIYDPGQNTLVTATVPISGAYLVKTLAGAPDGTVYGAVDSTKGHMGGIGKYAHLFQYNLNSGALVDLGTPFTNTNWTIQALVVAADGKVYGGGGPDLVVNTFYYSKASSPGSRIFVYDPATQTYSYPGSDRISISRARALLAGRDGKVYVGMEIGRESGFYIYDPATEKWTYWHIGEGEDASVAALAWGADGIIYGSTASELFTYDPRQPQIAPQIIGHLDRNGFTYLTAGPDGVIYGAIGSYDSFNPTVSELVAFRTDCAAGRVGAWERVTWEADTPRGTGVSVDVLDADGNTLVKDIRNGGSLEKLDPAIYPALRLRATLTTRNPQVSPVLNNWQVEYTFECQP
ncbi:MAG: hypothetical protein JXA21_06005 [Anaerolineae bacterium]|nr:hypothetical protein [Anaerolineae bacterium]